MVNKRHKPEEIVKKLRHVDVLVGQGMQRVDAIREVRITEQTYYRWRKQYGGMGTDQLKELKRLQKESERLRKAVSDGHGARIRIRLALTPPIHFSRDPYGNRPGIADHVIHCRDQQRDLLLLRAKSAGSQPTALAQTLDPRDGGFHQRSPAISIFFLPCHASMSGDLRGMTLPHRSSVSLPGRWNRVALRRYHDLRWRSVRPGIADSAVDRSTVISAIGHDRTDPPARILDKWASHGCIGCVIVGQPMRQDLARSGIERDVQLAPRAAFFAVFGTVPFASTEEFQTRTVEDQIHRCLSARSLHVDADTPPATNQCSVIRNRQIEPHQFQNRTDETFRLPQWQTEDVAERQHELWPKMGDGM